MLTGVLLVFICYPILIIISSVIMTALVLTFWAWMPVVLLGTYIFNITIYHF